MEIRGRGGEIRAGYQQAARIGAWTLQQPGAAQVYDLHAGLVEVNTFWGQTRPMTVRLLLPGGRYWVWSAEELAITATACSVVLTGPPQTGR